MWYTHRTTLGNARNHEKRRRPSTDSPSSAHTLSSPPSSGIPTIRSDSGSLGAALTGGGAAAGGVGSIASGVDVVCAAVDAEGGGPDGGVGDGSADAALRERTMVPERTASLSAAAQLCSTRTAPHRTREDAVRRGCGARGGVRLWIRVCGQPLQEAATPRATTTAVSTESHDAALAIMHQ